MNESKEVQKLADRRKFRTHVRNGGSHTKKIIFKILFRRYVDIYHFVFSDLSFPSFVFC